MVILVTGKNGQLGRCMQKSIEFDEKNDYFFFSHEELDISDENNVAKIFEQINPDFVINCAAYTNTRLAEKNYEESYEVNARAVEILSKYCEMNKSYLIHISTESVFDGEKNIPYKETDKTNPLSVYSKTKQNGEEFALRYNKSIVIRVSWLYSEYCNNFYKTMLERIHSKIKTNVVSDQIGVPTYANDLSDFIVKKIINCENINEKCGLYHFCNNGQASWYDFASAIESMKREFFDKNEIGRNVDNVYILPTTTEEYADVIKRPKYSVLCVDKIEKNFNYTPEHWLSALIRCMTNDYKLK